jgi:hypothetical protein
MRYNINVDKREIFAPLLSSFRHTKSLRFKNWRTRSQPIRTLSLIPVKIKITIEQKIPLYQKFTPKIKKLKILGLSNTDISEKLHINRKTVQKALSIN